MDASDYFKQRYLQEVETVCWLRQQCDTLGAEIERLQALLPPEETPEPDEAEGGADENGPDAEVPLEQ